MLIRRKIMKIYQEKITRKITINRKENFENREQIDIKSSWHKNFEICRFIRGNFDIIINNEKYSVQPGDIIVIKSGEIHRFENKEHDNCLDIVTFDPLILYNSAIDFGILKTHIKYEELKEAGVDKKIEECFCDLLSEIENKDSSAKILLKANLLKMYGLLLRYFENKDVSNGKLSKLIAIRNIIEYISDNYKEDITLMSLADRFNYSPQYISSAFATYAGVNFKYYLDNIRVFRAIEMLQETGMSISEIATNCGFDNIRTFNNVFKKITGDCPKSFRSN